MQSTSLRTLSCGKLGRVSENFGGAGGSAFREYERRQAKDAAEVHARKERVRARFGGGRFGSLVAAVSVDSRTRSSTNVWQQGAIGEAKVGKILDALRGPEFAVLHDRRVPRSRANIDHIVVTSAAIWVIDTKRYIGKRPERYVEGGLLVQGAAGLKVGGRKRDALLDGVLKQCALVEKAVSGSVPVRGMLCFVDADWPLIGGSFAVRGVRVTWPNRLARELESKSPAIHDVQAAAKFLTSQFHSS